VIDRGSPAPHDGIEVALPDGRVIVAEPGDTARSVAERHGIPEAGSAIAARLDGSTLDLDRPLGAAANDRAHLSFVRPEDPDALEILRHSTSHVMAQAVKQLYPDVKIAQGPAIENGFYYDFRREEPFTEEDLRRIEKRMHKIVKRNLPIRRHEVSREHAISLFREEDEPYKLYFVESKSGPIASYYEQGEFRDFCRGPHVPSTGRIGAFRLLSVAGAYWLGSERNEMLWRIYGTAFPTEEELQAHLDRLEEARRRDHRRLGRELDLFSIQDAAGSGLVFWHPKGSSVRHRIQSYLREELERRDYVFVDSPHMARDELFRISGHYDYYSDNMFILKSGEDEEFVVKPMNCPGHVMIYASRLRSYRELPVRMAEFGTVYRNERSGTLAGLLRVRGFTQDDAHIFCRPDQIVDEIDDCLDLVETVFRTFGFTEAKYELSVWDSAKTEKYAGESSQWEAAEAGLVKALERRGLEYSRFEGEAAFYGPKIDVKVLDAIGRPWQLSTIQFDFNLPKRFDISFVDQDGQAKPPIMIHRAIFGSLERFFGILVEHYAGAFPVWLAPVQARILPVSEKVLEYGEKVLARLRDAGVRAELDRRSDKIGAKIRDAEMEKIPYMLIVGPREASSESVSLRVHRDGDQGASSVENFIERARGASESRALEA
jgi:threonyl-tRNA synthetase